MPVLWGCGAPHQEDPWLAWCPEINSSQSVEFETQAVQLLRMMEPVG